MQAIEFGVPFEMLVVPSIGSSAMSKSRRTRHPGPEMFAFENSRRVVLDPLADHDFAADVHQIEHPADRIARRRVG